MGQKGMRLSDRDVRTICHLWFWKMATTSTLATLYYNSITDLSCYSRLWRLEKAGFIRAVCSSNGKEFVWILNSSGFEVFKGRCWAQFRDSGYKSECIGHDLWASAIHQGEWIYGVPQSCDVFTEQQLRRYSLESYPEWVPKTDMHRPDGYWLVNDGTAERVVALEVELNQKSLDTYRTYGDNYSIDISCSDVIWVLGSNCNPDSIHKALISRLNGKSSPHSTLLLEDFLKEGWLAKFIGGKHEGISMRNILATSKEHENKLSYLDVLLDTRKKPIKSIQRPKKEDALFFQ